MTSKTIRRATADDVPILTQIRNDAHAKKVGYRDYAWGKEANGFSENWVRNNVSQKEVYVVELACTPVATFSLVLDDDDHWGAQEPIAGYVHGLSVRKGFNGRGLGSFMLDWCANKVSGLNRRFVSAPTSAVNPMLSRLNE